MNIILYISLIFTSAFFSAKKPAQRAATLCDVYGLIYVEPNNKNKADLIVYVDNNSSFPEARIFVQENKLYADRPGMWAFTKDPRMADFIIYIEKEEGRTRHVLSYTDTESRAGCQ